MATTTGSTVKARVSGGKLIYWRRLGKVSFPGRFRSVPLTKIKSIRLANTPVGFYGGWTVLMVQLSSKEFMSYSVPAEFYDEVEKFIEILGN